MRGIALDGPPVAVAPPEPVPLPTVCYGKVDIARYSAIKAQLGWEPRIWFAGVDVTDWCYECDDVAGYVLVVCNAAAERSGYWGSVSNLVHIGRGEWVEQGGIQRARLHGHVVLTRGASV